MPTSLLTVIALVVLGTILLVALLSGCDMKRFLARTPELRSPEDLAYFKRLVARQMYIALLVIALVAGVVLALAVSFLYGLWKWEELGLVLGLGSGGILTLVGAWLKAIERHVQSVPAAYQELGKERDHVVSVWRSKKFPDW